MKTALLAALFSWLSWSRKRPEPTPSTWQTDEKVAELDQILPINP
jgi:hypothetical protein